jgi:transcriptional accessory protein Tex/SPT6
LRRYVGAFSRYHFFARGVCVITPIDKQIAQELGVRAEQVATAVALLDDGATVPFIAHA